MANWIWKWLSQNMRQPPKHGAQKIVAFYNLVVIISVSYRVKSQIGIVFREFKQETPNASALG